MSEKEFRNEDAVLDIKDRPQAFHWVGLSLQHLFTMFGATVLVPILLQKEKSPPILAVALLLLQRCRC